MERAELQELHYITPIANVPSIIEHGILSHRRVARIRHESVAMPELQAKRAKVRIPGGRSLHEYVNLYLCARNPMLLKRKSHHDDLCVLRISPSVLDIAGTVVTGQNAGSKYARFAPAPDGLRLVCRDWTFADDWRDPDKIQFWIKKSAKCAEVLVLDVVPSRHISGAYVSGQRSLLKLKAHISGLDVVENSDMFFR